MKFFEFLHHKKESIFPCRERILKRIFNRRKKMVLAFVGGAIGCIVLGIGALFFFLSPQQQAEEEIILTGAMNIIESITTEEGKLTALPTDATLLINTSEDVAVKELMTRISLEPAIEFELDKRGECQYELSFEELEENTLYNIKAVYNGKDVYRWAFQTVVPFKITDAYPTKDVIASVDSAVEITFSHSEAEGFEKAFSIYPKVEGTFEHHGRTWSFIPTAPLAESTLYTVTIKDTVKSPDGEKLLENYTFSFRTEDGESFAYLMYQGKDLADSFLINERPVAVLAHQNTVINHASVQVYSLKDSAAYINAYKKYVSCGMISDKIMDLAKTKQMEFTVKPILVSDYNGVKNAAFIHYPDALPQGYYFSKIECGGRVLYQLIQSTELSVYALSSNGDHVVWVNNGRTGTPLSDVTLSLDGFSEIKTSDAGVGILKNSKKPLGDRFLKVEYGKYPYVVVLDGGSTDQALAKRAQYYSYIAANASVYRSGEKITIFGAILPRGKDVEEPENLSLDSPLLAEPIEIMPDENGAFKAEFELPSTMQTYGEINLMLDGVWMDRTYFSIQGNESPAYIISATTNQKAYKAGDTVYFDIQVTHSDGTPAKEIMVVGDGFKGKTDESGNLSGSYTAVTEDPAANYSLNRLYFQIDGKDIFANIPYLVFASDYIVEAQYKDGQLKVATYEVDYEAAEALTEDDLRQMTFTVRDFTGKSVSAKLSLELHELSFTKEAIGGGYNFREMKAEPAYRYTQQDSILRTESLNCSAGIGSVDFNEKPTYEKNYYVNLIAEDRQTVLRRVYFNDPSIFSSFDSDSAYDMTINQEQYGVGDTVTLRVRDGQYNGVVNHGSVIYTVVSGGVVDVFQSDSSLFSIKFKEEYAPCATVYGAYFDGSHIHSLGKEELNYNQKDSALKIEMEQELEQGEVNLRFKVTDAKDQPIEATLNISLIDQKLYLSNGNLIDPISGLYSKAWESGVASTFQSHRDFYRDNVEETGEGWEGLNPVICDYLPSPYSEMITTDSKGEAEVTVSLPESSAQWKVIAQGVHSSAKGGFGVFDLDQSRGFYTQVIIGDRFKSSDDCVIALRGAGDYLKKGDLCDFKIGLTDKDGNEIATKNGHAESLNYAFINFGKLTEGRYTAYIQSTCGALNDDRIVSFEIKGHRNAVWIQGESAMETASATVHPTQGKVILSIVDEENTFYLTSLERLNNASGNRIDQALAQCLTTAYRTDGSWKDGSVVDYSSMKNYLSNGFKLRADADHSDLKLSAKLAAVMPEVCDRRQMTDYFKQYLNNRYASNADVLAAYLGLSALKEPMLADLQRIYQSSSSFELEEWIYLSLSFAYAGDYDTAEYIYQNRIKSSLVMEEGSGYIAIDGVVSEELTGAFSLLANRLSLECGESVINYLTEHDNDTTLPNLAMISYINDYVVNQNGENEVTVSIGGEVVTHRYQKHMPLILALDGKEVCDIRITDRVGKSHGGFGYYGSAEKLEGAPLSGLEIHREFPYGEVKTIGLTISIPKDFDASKLQFTLPAGLQFIDGMIASDGKKSTVSAVNNGVDIEIGSAQNEVELTLRVRGIMPGEFTMEPIVLIGNGGKYMVSDTVELSIK